MPLIERHYATVLLRGWPGAEWSLRGNDIENGLEWYGPGDQPSAADIIAAAEDAWLAEARAVAKAEIDRQAEVAREAYITAGSGQAMVYLEKQREARAYMDDMQGDYPLLAAMVDIDINPASGFPVATIGEGAQVVLALAAAWKTAAIGIEKRRLRAKRAVDGAESVEDVEAAMTAEGWAA